MPAPDVRKFIPWNRRRFDCLMVEGPLMPRMKKIEIMQHKKDDVDRTTFPQRKKLARTLKVLAERVASEKAQPSTTEQ